jgi:hypothetical protein
MRELIRHIIKEELSSRQKKLLNLINNIGMYNASTTVGGISRLISIVGEDNITTDNKISFIKGLIKTVHMEFISIDEMGEEPIHIDEEDDIISQIEILYSDEVLVDYIDNGYSDIESVNYSRGVGYEKLPEQIIDEIYNMIVNYCINVLGE